MKLQKAYRSDGSLAWLLLDDEYEPILPVMKYLRYLEAVDRSPNTILAYAGDLKLLFEFLSSRGLAWQSLKISDISEFSIWLRCPTEPDVVPLYQEAQRSEKTVNRILGTLVSFYEFHERCGAPGRIDAVRLKRSGFRQFKPFLHHISKGHAARRRLFKLREPRRFPGCLSAAEVSQLVESCTCLRDKFLLCLLYETGLRIGEALGLYHEDLESGGKNVVRVMPRRHLDIRLRQKSKAERVVEVSVELMRLYSAYLLDEYPASPYSNYVFVRRAGDSLQPLSYSLIQGLFRRLERRTGIRASPHLFRHTHATELIRAGCSMRYVQLRLGHAQIQTTINTYTHLTEEDLSLAYHEFRRDQRKDAESKAGQKK